MGEHHPLLLGVQSCTATMEINVAVSQKVGKLVYLKIKLYHLGITQRKLFPTTGMLAQLCSLWLCYGQRLEAA